MRHTLYKTGDHDAPEAIKDRDAVVLQMCRVCGKAESELEENNCRASSADQILESMAATYRERNAIYGDNFKRVGPALAALFPDGIMLKTGKDHERFYLFVMEIVKLSRYANNFAAGGHKDSMHDAAVYAAIIEAVDHGY